MSRTMNCGSGRELEALDEVRLETEGTPDPADCGLRHPRRLRHRTRRPVRRRDRRLLQRLHDHPLDILVTDRPRLPRPPLVMQARQVAARQIGPATYRPCPAHGRAEPRSRCSVRQPPQPARSGSAAPTPARCWAAAPNARASPLLLARHHNRCLPPSLSHRRLQSSLTTTGFGTPTHHCYGLTAQDTSHRSLTEAI